MRSLLLVTAESDAELDRALAAGADVIVIDLADSAAAEAATAPRRRATDFLRETRGPARLFVRIHPLSSPLAVADLDAVVPSRPHGIVLPRAAGGADVTRLSAMLRPREAIAGIDDGAIAIIAMAADTAVGLFTLGSYGGASARLARLGWEAAALSTALGARSSRDAAGNLTDAVRLARSLTLAGAAAAGVAAIDTPFVDAGDLAGLERETAEARDAGFVAKFAVNPDQVAVINQAFALKAASGL
jgi:citrate lyase subunit beta/citryl-CoA lyase